MAFTEEEIINGTTIIAKFMGYKVGLLSGWVTGKHEYYYKKEANGYINEATPLPSGKFHKSWDWIMAVVEKIEATPVYGIYGTAVTIWFRKEGVTIEYKGGDVPSEFYSTIKPEEPTSKAKLAALYKAVIEYINWYNKVKDYEVGSD